MVPIINIFLSGVIALSNTVCEGFRCFEFSLQINGFVFHVELVLKSTWSNDNVGHRDILVFYFVNIPY